MWFNQNRRHAAPGSCQLCLDSAVDKAASMLMPHENSFMPGEASPRNTLGPGEAQDGTKIRADCRHTARKKR